MSTWLNRCATSKWFLAIFLIVSTHYATLLYYTTFNSSHSRTDTSNTWSGLRHGDPRLVEPRVVVFPVNPEYQAKKFDGSSKLSTARNATSFLVTNTSSKHAPTVRNTSVVGEKINRLILAWTVLHSRKPLWGIRPWSFRSCEYTNCVMTGNRSLLDSADLLIFRIRELKSVKGADSYRPYVLPIDLTDLPPYHRAGQLWMDINEVSYVTLSSSFLVIVVFFRILSVIKFKY